MDPRSAEHEAAASPRAVKVLIINDYGVLAGGAERVSVLLRDGLRSRGHDARLFASTALPVRSENPADYTCFGSESQLRRALQVANPWAFRMLRQVIGEFEPEVIHVRMFLTQLSPLILPLIRDVPSLLHLGNYQLICPLNTKRLPDGSSCRHVAGKACYRAGCVSLPGLGRVGVQLGLWQRWRDGFDLIVANSEWLARRYRDDGFVVNEVIWNGTPLGPARRPLRDPPTVAYAGRLVHKKGVDVLLRAFAANAASVPESRLLIVGDGPQRSELERLVAELEIEHQVVLSGYLKRHELERALGSAWVQAIPSRYEEPFPNVAIEAMMRGTAVVATALGGSTEIVRDGHTGYLVAPNDVEALASRLRKLITDRALAEAAGAAGREVALADFPASRMGERFELAYRGILSANRCGAASAVGLDEQRP